MDSMSGTKLYGNRGRIIQLADYIHRGGEGSVYRIKGNSASVVKIFHTDNDRYDEAAMRKKLSVMLRHPPQYGKNPPCCAWPTEIVNYENGHLAGYLMPYVNDIGNIKSATRTSEIIRLFQDYTWKTGVRIAKNLAVAFQQMHDNDIVIGDSNFSNMRIMKDLRVVLIDNDSFTITDPDTGIVYKTQVTRPDYVPPELIDRNWGSADTHFTVDSDRFTLATHIFSLLCNNAEPFSCIQTSPLPQIKGDGFDPVRCGRCAYVTNHSTFLLPQECAPDMEALPQSIRTLFDRCFTYDETNAQSASVIRQRPSAGEWVQALTELDSSRFRKCTADKRHVYVQSLRYDNQKLCPWCALENGSTFRKLTGRTPAHLPIQTPYNSPGTPPPKPAKTVKQKQNRPVLRLLVTAFNIWFCINLAFIFNVSFRPEAKIVCILIGALTAAFITWRTTRQKNRLLWPMLASLLTTMPLAMAACVIIQCT